jgi:hypothetical protein
MLAGLENGLFDGGVINAVADEFGAQDFGHSIRTLESELRVEIFPRA